MIFFFLSFFLYNFLIAVLVPSHENEQSFSKKGYRYNTQIKVKE